MKNKQPKKKASGTSHQASVEKNAAPAAPTLADVAGAAQALHADPAAPQPPADLPPQSRGRRGKTAGPRGSANRPTGPAVEAAQAELDAAIWRMVTEGYTYKEIQAALDLSNADPIAKAIKSDPARLAVAYAEQKLARVKRLEEAEARLFNRLHLFAEGGTQFFFEPKRDDYGREVTDAAGQPVMRLRDDGAAQEAFAKSGASWLTALKGAWSDVATRLANLRGEATAKVRVEASAGGVPASALAPAHRPGHAGHDPSGANAAMIPANVAPLMLGSSAATNWEFTEEGLVEKAIELGRLDILPPELRERAAQKMAIKT